MSTLSRHWSQVFYPLFRGLCVGAIATGGLLVGIVPTVTLSGVSFGTRAAHAQSSVSNSELTNYARSLLVIEPLRQDAVDAIKDIVGSGNIPSIRCDVPESLENLANNIEPIARDYCEEAGIVVRRNSLTFERFNEITVLLSQQGASSDLHDRLEDELIRLQQ